jgi:hypothetical protein
VLCEMREGFGTWQQAWQLQTRCTLVCCHIAQLMVCGRSSCVHGRGSFLAQQCGLPVMYKPFLAWPSILRVGVAVVVRAAGAAVCFKSLKAPLSSLLSPPLFTQAVVGWPCFCEG